MLLVLVVAQAKQQYRAGEQPEMHHLVHMHLVKKRCLGNILTR